MNHKLPLPLSESLCNIVYSESASSSRAAFLFTRFCCVWCINSCNFCRWVWSSVSTWGRATKETTKQKNVTANSTQWETNVSWTFSWQKSLISLWDPKTSASLFAVRNATLKAVRLLNALTLMIFDLRSFPVVNFSTLMDLVFSWLAVILRFSRPFLDEIHQTITVSKQPGQMKINCLLYLE